MVTTTTSLNDYDLSYYNITNILNVDDKLVLILPYFLGTNVKTYEHGRYAFRGTVTGYYISDQGVVVNVTEHNTNKSYGFLPSEIQLDDNNNEVENED